MNSFAYVSVSEGVGVGLALNGEMLRGEHHTAGEFGHVSLDSSGPECVCGRRGCWEALVCNATTVERYVSAATGSVARADLRVRRTRRPGAPGIDEVVRRARGGEVAAIRAPHATPPAKLAGDSRSSFATFNPGRIYVGGEITEAWDLIERPIRDALGAGTIAGSADATQVVPASDGSLAHYLAAWRGGAGDGAGLRGARSGMNDYARSK